MRQITQSRLDEEQASIEARVFDAILNCQEKVESGKLSTQAVTEKFNEDLAEKDRATSRLLGRKIAALGFEKCRVGSKGQAGFYWDAKLVERLKLRYYPPPLKLTSETSETSETSVSMGKQACENGLAAEVSEVNPQVEPLEKSRNSIKTGVSEETEVSEVNLGGMPKPSATPPVNLEDLKSVYWSDSFYGWHRCAVCGETKLSAWQAETFKGEKAWLCEDCKTAWEKQRGEA